MDPYFRPILLATLIVIVLNTVFFLPFAGAPLFSYFLGGIFAVYFFRKEMKSKGIDQEVKVFDASVLGLSTGVLVGGILSLIMAFKLQDPEMRQTIIDIINKSMKMHSEAEFYMLNDLGPTFFVVTTIMTIGICASVSLFGSIMVLPFMNKPRK